MLDCCTSDLIMYLTKKVNLKTIRDKQQIFLTRGQKISLTENSTRVTGGDIDHYTIED